MSIRYPDDMSAWEEWQREYRYGGFYLFPPPGIIEVVDDLRQRHDPRSHALCQAHVTLTEPLPRPLANEDLAELATVLSGVQPFTITYGDVHSTAPYPGVVYRIEPINTFMSLRQAIHESSLFANSPLRRKDVPPHMTIAEFITLDESVALAGRLAEQVEGGQWLCANVEYAVPDQRMRFHRVLAFPLGAQSSGAANLARRGR